jgi:hypothetical protein
MKTHLLAAAIALAAASFPVPAAAADFGSPPPSDTTARPFYVDDVRPLHALSDTELDTERGGQLETFLTLAATAGKTISDFLSRQPLPPPPPPPPFTGPTIFGPAFTGPTVFRRSLCRYAFFTYPCP